MQKVLQTDNKTDLASFIVHFLEEIDHEVKFENNEFTLYADVEQIFSKFKDEYETEDLNDLIEMMWYDIDYAESYMDVSHPLYNVWIKVLKKLEAMKNGR